MANTAQENTNSARLRSNQAQKRVQETNATERATNLLRKELGYKPEQNPFSFEGLANTEAVREQESKIISALSRINLMAGAQKQEEEGEEEEEEYETEEAGEETGYEEGAAEQEPAGRKLNENIALAQAKQTAENEIILRLQYEVEIAAKQTIKKLTLQATRTIISIAVKYLGATVGSIFSFTFIAIIIGFGITYLYWNLQLFGWIVARSRGHENWWLLGPPRFLSDIPALFGWEKLTKFLFFIDLCLLILSDTIIFILILDTVVLFLVVILNIMQHPIQTTIGILWDLIMSVFGLVN